jgi:hypothetical protein
MPDNGELIRLLTDMKESLERRLESMDDRMTNGFASIEGRFEAQDARLDAMPLLYKPEAGGSIA